MQCWGVTEVHRGCGWHNVVRSLGPNDYCVPGSLKPGAAESCLQLEATNIYQAVMHFKDCVCYTSLKPGTMWSHLVLEQIGTLVHNYWPGIWGNRDLHNIGS
jgi:hypothetical protein